MILNKPTLHSLNLKAVAFVLTVGVTLQTGLCQDTDASFQITHPQRLTYAELKRAAQSKVLSEPLSHKINILFNTPFIYRNQSLISGGTSWVSEKPLTLRATAWNIERGFNLSQIISVFSPTPSTADLPASAIASPHPEEKASSLATAPSAKTDMSEKMPGTVANADSTPFTLNSKTVSKEQAFKNRQQEQKQWIDKSSVLLFTEVDYGMRRTNYKNITLELAKALNMNAAYGVEFLELSPFTHYKLTHPNETRAAVTEKAEKGVKKTAAVSLIGEDAKVDPDLYKGLHGIAVLSKYPIQNARVLRLPVCYDWYNKEQEKLSQLEKVRRVGSETIFLEDVLTELRRGGRIALIVDLAVPSAPNGTVTFVAAHLENRTVPKCRCDQMSFLLNHLKDIQNPVVIGGDWNTSGTDVSPTSVPKEVRVRLKDPSFWTLTTLKLLNPFTAAISYGLNVTGYLKNLYNPAAMNIPLILPNKEKQLFNTLENFRFSDKRGFITSGSDSRSYTGKSGFLSDSNQLAFKGYVPTFSLERPLFNGLVGKYKLDWFAVKPDTAGQLMPKNGRTLTELNTIYGRKISDHCPITVDLTLKPVETDTKVNSTQLDTHAEIKTPDATP